MDENSPALRAEDVGMACASVVVALVAALDRQGFDAKKLLADFEDELDRLQEPMEGTPAGDAMAVCISALVWSDPDGPESAEMN